MDRSIVATAPRKFKKFLITLDGEIPAGLDVHLVCDNYATHKVPAVAKLFAAHPRFHMHFTPTYASWLSQVERWFALPTDKKLRQGAHRSIQALEKDIRDWVATWNENPNPSAGLISACPVRLSGSELMSSLW
jgi:transposase